MADLYHWLGDDLELSPSNDLLTVDGLERGRQRVIRRCCTVPGTYWHHPTYGVGIQLYIGEPVDPLFLKNLIRTQIFQEACVKQNPPPTISLQPILNGIFVRIIYTDNDSGQDVVAEMNVVN